jgi:hypothetical protein
VQHSLIGQKIDATGWSKTIWSVPAFSERHALQAEIVASSLVLGRR